MKSVYNRMYGRLWQQAVVFCDFAIGESLWDYVRDKTLDEIINPFVFAPVARQNGFYEFLYWIEREEDQLMGWHHML